MTQLWNSKREEEENINKRKLLYDGHGVGDDRKLLSLIKAITKFCLNEESSNEDEIDKSSAQITQHIQQSIVASQRIERMLQVCREDLKLACQEFDEEELNIIKAKSDIEKARLDLEYEAKVKMVNILPSCSSTQERIVELQEKRRELATKTIKHHEQLEKISKICDEFEIMLKESLDKPSDELIPNGKPLLSETAEQLLTSINSNSAKNIHNSMPPIKMTVD